MKLVQLGFGLARSSKCAVLFLALLVCLPYQQANAKKRPFFAPGFEFSQVDVICVMPPVSKVNTQPPLDLVSLRTVIVQGLEQRGYKVDTSCVSERDGASQVGASHWLFTITVEGFGRNPAGAYNAAFLGGSVFDTQASKEVWNDHTLTPYGARYKAALVGGIPEFDRLVSQALKPLLETIPARKSGQ